MDLALSLVLSAQATLNVFTPQTHHDPSHHRSFAPALPFTLLTSTHPADLSFLMLSLRKVHILQTCTLRTAFF